MRPPHLRAMPTHDAAKAQERSVIGGFYAVYNELGFGFLEEVYSAALEIELRLRGHRVAREVWVDVHYRGQVIRRQRIDMLVDENLVVENKSTVALPPHTTRQTYNYLHATKLERGLVLHFGPEARFHRVRCPNKHDASFSPR
jgi:GxxExxY protein